MISPLQTATIPLPPADIREILRYAGARSADDALLSLLEQTLQEAEPVLNPRLCLRTVAVSCADGEVDLEFARIRSESLCRMLEGCTAAVVFAATLGIGLDRQIARFGRIAPARGLLLQAIGAERIEALCDSFCRELQHRAGAEGLQITRRFSPGYGDLPLTFQRELFRLLDCSRAIGLTLNDSLLMSPTKSVTAIVGMGPRCTLPEGHHCSQCSKTDCIYRRSL